MADVKDEIDRQVKQDEAATRKAAQDLADAAQAVDEQTREAVQQTFDKIKTNREARERQRVKKTDQREQP